MFEIEGCLSDRARAGCNKISLLNAHWELLLDLVTIKAYNRRHHHGDALAKPIKNIHGITLEVSSSF
jgi:hypothetical protein